MSQRLRFLILALALAVLLPVTQPAPALAADVPAGTDVRIPKPAIEWLKKNWTSLYLVFDEIMDDLTGCPCSPAPQTPPTAPPW